MYAAVLICTKGGGIPVTVEMKNSFRKLKEFVRNGINTGEIRQKLTDIELDGYDPQCVDQIIITSTNKTKPGHTRMSVSL